METVLQDIRYGLRVLRKNAAYTALAAITLALGIGANTAIFSVVYRVIFSPLPYVQPDRLVRVVLRWKQGGMADDLTPILAQAIADDSRLFSSVAVEFPSTGCNLVGGSTPEYVPAKRVSAGFFRTLGTTPALGREFLEQEAAGSAHSAIISYGLWQTRLGGDAGILGRQIACNGEPATVVGVLPRGFQYAQQADVWLPDRLANHVRDAEGLNFTVIGLLLSMVGLYALLSYDVNQRTQEIGIRMALGAPRERMLSMVVQEGIVLVAVGTTIGIGGALAASRLLASLLFGIGALDGVSFAGAIVCLVIVGLLASLIPARRATRVDPMVALRYE